MQTNTIRVIAAVVDTHNLTLYKTDGETVVIPQGDTRIRPILDIVTPQLIKQGFADVYLAEINSPSDYAKFEEASSGAVKLFRIAKSKLKGWFGKKEDAPVEPVETMSVGIVPCASTVSITQAVEEILAHAIPAASPEFHDRGIPQQGNVVEQSGITIKEHSKDDAPDTIIAVVEGKVIPGVEKIKTQFGRAAKQESTKGMENFLRRMASVIDARKHSVEDLLKFMERGDLPVAEDGSILIYKVLRKSGKKYVDCHTRKVEQWVGGYVCMDPSLVDHNRNNECSNGLHVARRGYIREFSGDVCVLAKVAPEDVIAVPSYDANKMRVCGYHIIAELTSFQYQLVRQNKPITDDPDGKILLANTIAGNHTSKTHEIRITEQNGGGVKVTKLGKAEKEAPATKIAPVEALANPAKEAKEAPVNPKDIVKTVEHLSRKDIAAKLYREGDFAALKAFKKAAKVSWEKLGVPDPGDALGTVAKTKKEAPKSEANKAEFNTVAAKATRSIRVVNDVVLGEGSYKERIQKLLAIGLTSVGVAKAILELKKKSKKGWSALGVSDTQAEQITNLAQ